MPQTLKRITRIYTYRKRGRINLQEARGAVQRRNGLPVEIHQCGKTVNIFTGPPCDAEKDKSIVRQFLAKEGTKVVCGGTTAKITADYLGTDVTVEADLEMVVAPPHYHIDGVDLVTEGAITLNQVYNVLDEEESHFDEECGVTQLHELLASADRVNFVVGRAINPASGDISFRQKGILTRHAIVPLIAKKLQELGKLVVVSYV